MKKAGYAVESFRSDKGERTYRIKGSVEPIPNPHGAAVAAFPALKVARYGFLWRACLFCPQPGTIEGRRQPIFKESEFYFESRVFFSWIPG
jgi:hypothetical protein